ncbi:MAG: metalloregulator ArsR/SmtB family transcription factor [Candidatus Electryonea clarkiae]|nr:metalloregulator ArsR/SmtB family transcription factor [Candidatus Electryonea clarkiae]MDP8287793.1 metalloregulator ArsR/SmtB family transcription factor [Candidatus Electryonea clarkiae]
MSNYRKEDLVECAEMFNALSHPHRLRIFVDHLKYCNVKEAGVGISQARSYMQEIAEELGIAPSTVSHHLKELRQAGLIKIERNGQRVSCWVEKDIAEKLSAFFVLKDN